MAALRKNRSTSKSVLLPCSLPLTRQVEGMERGTVRRGEHPRAQVRRVDLLSDEELDRFRETHPEASAAAMDGSLTIEETLDVVLAEKRIDDARLAKLPMRPILTVFVCLACGTSSPARAWRAWPVDRAMRASGLAERDLVRVEALLHDMLGDRAPQLDRFDADGIIELASLLGRDIDHSSLRDRLGELHTRAQVAEWT
jgi:hypothetical protein